LAAQDTVFFALDDGAAGTGAFAVRIGADAGIGVPIPVPPHPVGTTPPADTVALNDAGLVKAYTTSNDTVNVPVWTTVSPVNVPADPDGVPWLEDVVTWRSSPGAVWAVSFKIHLNTGANSLGITAPSRLFAGLRIRHGASTVINLGSEAPVATTSGVGGETIIPLRPAPIAPATANPWGPVTAPGVACVGVRLNRLDVGTVSSPADVAAPGNQVSATSANTFRVIARGLPDAFSGVGQAVRARIRVADWGSTIASREFAPWKDIAGVAPPGPSVFVADASAFSTGWSNGFVDDVGPTGRWVINYTCAIQSGNTYCPKLSPGAPAHQCVLVELGAKDPGITFEESAVYRNMEFAGLSSLRDPASITLEGLHAATGVARARDVYIYVQTLHMPEHGFKPLELDAKGMALSRRYLEAPPALPPPRRGRDARRQNAERAALPVEVGPFDTPVLTADQALTTAWPTYMVHVYYDTGKTSELDGETLKVLEPMVPFGYYLEHDGPLYGFTHRITGLDGVELEELEPNFYRVRIPSEGKIRVENSITAEEEPKKDRERPPPVDRKIHCNCRIVGSPAQHAPAPLLVALLGLAWLRRRAQQRPREKRG
jgi:MYXO-CTERM domain-containing protein